MTTDEHAIELMKKELEQADDLELLLNAGKKLPADWRSHSVQRNFQSIRCRLRFTQEELALKAGLTQSQISRVESGADALVSTWTRVYKAMGFQLVLVRSNARGAREARRGRTPGGLLDSAARPPAAPLVDGGKIGRGVISHKCPGRFRRESSHSTRAIIRALFP